MQTSIAKPNLPSRENTCQNMANKMMITQSMLLLRHTKSPKPTTKLWFPYHNQGLHLSRPLSSTRAASRSQQSRNSSTTTGHNHQQPAAKGRPVRDLRGKVAIVTGAGSQGDDIGNGRATSILLAEDGASVICVDKQFAPAKRTVSMIDDMGANPLPNVHHVPRRGNAIAIEADVTSERDCKRIVEKAISSFGRLDILVNVVGIIGAKGTAVDVDVSEWAKGLEINVTSMMLMARFAIPAMMRNERSDNQPVCGSIVNIGSVAGLRGGTPHLFYPTSKGAVVNMTRAMAAHHGPDGIRVNCVCPGMLFTPMMYGAGNMSSEKREARRKRSLLGTEGNAWDCASAIRFLAGDESRWITGAILTVDAGATAAVSLPSTN
ncbi:hypothetical protein B0H66DRAFT_271035 [Apodospora peruviana]|uniref:Uncharacterized protein n=1 Tax=Apodospora peruviana TaxID=516989 RepID=A0AAE0M2Q9_9PEZI|nr:hypothetical protein B0H66DRAFT_271035 [Apodospora peruviana]